MTNIRISGRRTPDGVFDVGDAATPPTINTSEFRWSRTHHTFTADASDLAFPPGGTPTTINLLSERTGDVIPVRLTKTHRDPDDDVTHWEFQPLDDDGRLLHRFRVLVWND